MELNFLMCFISLSKQFSCGFLELSIWPPRVLFRLRIPGVTFMSKVCFPCGFSFSPAKVVCNFTRKQPLASQHTATVSSLFKRNFVSNSLARVTHKSSTAAIQNDGDESLPGKEQLELATSNAVDMLRSLKKQPTIAFSYFNQLNNSGFRHDISTYGAIIRILCSWGLYRNLESIFVGMIGVSGDGNAKYIDLLELLVTICGEVSADGKRQSLLMVKVGDVLVKTYVTLGMFDEAVDALFRMGMFGFVPHIFTCNFLLNRLIDKGKLDMSLAIYKQLNRLGVSSNDYTYAIAIKALCKMGNLEEALNVFRDMEGEGVTPTPFAYTAYIEGLCANAKSDLAFQVLRTWKAAGVPIDGYAYMVVIRGFCNEMKLDEAESVLLDMETQGVLPDMRCYAALICGFCKKGSLLKASDLVTEMVSKGVKINCVILTPILHCMCEMGLYAEVIDQFHDFQKLGIFVDEVSYNIAVDALCKLGKVDDSLALLNEMKGKKMELDILHYTTLINGYCFQGKLCNALKVFDEMTEKGFKPDAVLCNVLAGGFSRKGFAKEALALLDFMEKENIKPNSGTHNMIIENLCVGGKVREAELFFGSIENKSADNYAAMINGYCRANCTAEACSLFYKLLGHGLVMKRSCCYSLLQSLCEERNVSAILMVFDTMLTLNIDPSKALFGKIIAALCMAGDMCKAKLVFDLFVRAFVPDIITYTIMINTYCKMNCLHEALDLFSDMKRRGVNPDIVTFTVLLDGHVKDCRSKHGPSAGARGRSHEAVAPTPSVLLAEMNNVEVRPDVICYTVLIDGHCKVNNLEDAINVFDEMLERGLEPDTVTYTALLSGCCNRGDVDVAVNLLDQMSTKGISPDARMMSTLHRGILRARKVQFWKH